MKKKYKFYLWAITGCIVVVVIIIERRKVSNRKYEADYTIVVVTNKGKRAKGEKYVAYKFTVNKVEYYGTANIRFCNECREECCHRGAKVNVRYERQNPANNDLVH